MRSSVLSASIGLAEKAPIPIFFLFALQDRKDVLGGEVPRAHLYGDKRKADARTSLSGPQASRAIFFV